MKLGIVGYLNFPYLNNLNKTHISELFRYTNPCIYIYVHGELVRNWCGVWEVDIWKRVRHDRLFN